MQTRQEIIVPGHPRWTEFRSSLSRCRTCFGTTDQARGVLADMDQVNVEGSLRELGRLGGTCDCQIELDVAYPSASMDA